LISKLHENAECTFINLLQIFVKVQYLLFIKLPVETM